MNRYALSSTFSILQESDAHSHEAGRFFWFIYTPSCTTMIFAHVLCSNLNLTRRNVEKLIKLLKGFSIEIDHKSPLLITYLVENE